MEDNNNEKTWYNIKEENGEIVIEKTSATETAKVVEETPQNTEEEQSKVEDVQQYHPVKKKRKALWIGLFVSLVLLLTTIVAVLLINNDQKIAEKKYRTFMIYMVGSDLESNGSMATFDLNDLKNSKVDLNDNHIVLIVGGSKKWHNFVKEDEIGIYELTSEGFKKKKTMATTSMGAASLLENFLEYSYKYYPAEKYDMIFWNHGLGAVGLESDEVSSDYLSINELDAAFKSSPFKDKKLEIVVFNNCLSGNIHFANIMSSYAEYMVASEEVMYVGSIIDRMNFIEDVKKSDTGYEIGVHYVEKTDESMNKLNSKSFAQYDSTLAVIDLSKVKVLDEKMNSFFETINLDNDYTNIARVRKRLHTYSESTGYVYDTVDLYELVEALEPYSSNISISQDLKNEIKDTIKYNSALNIHSNGISIYFPYYGSSEYVEIHLMYFKTLWNNSYMKFIEKFYENNNSIRSARRATSLSDVNYLENDVTFDGSNQLRLVLNDEEKDLYQGGNIYIFSKENERYKLLLKSSDIRLEDNTIIYDHDVMLNIGDNNITLIDDGRYKVYGTINNMNVIEFLDIQEDEVNELNVLLDSGDSPSNGILDFEEEKMESYYAYSYILEENDMLKSDWKDTIEKEKIEINGEFNINNNLNDCYALIEMYDINNDVFYSRIIKIEQ